MNLLTLGSAISSNFFWYTPVIWLTVLGLLVWLRRAGSPAFWPMLGFALILLFNFCFTENYFLLKTIDGRLSGYLVGIFRNGAPIMLVALGMTLVIATGGVDLSVGATMAIAAVISAAMVSPSWLADTFGPWSVKVLNNHELAWIMLLVSAAIVVSMLVGAWNGLLVSVFRVQPIIATLILMVAGRGVAQLICGGTIYTYELPRLAYMGQGTLLTLPFAVWLVGVMILVTWLMTRRTALGLMIESVGDNDLASHYTGLRARTIKFLAYVFAGACAGIAGLIVSTNVQSANANKIGLWFELDAIFAVVVGGTALTGGRYFLFGSIVGAVLIEALTSTMYALDVMPEIALIPKAMVILAVCLLQSPPFRRQVLGPFAKLRTGGAG